MSGLLRRDCDRQDIPQHERRVSRLERLQLLLSGQAYLGRQFRRGVLRFRGHEDQVCDNCDKVRGPALVKRRVELGLLAYRGRFPGSRAAKMFAQRCWCDRG